MQFRRLLGVDKASIERRRDGQVSQGVELTVTVALFVLVGLAIDALAGTRPWFTVGFAVFAAVGGTLSAWLRYQTRIAELDRDKPWTRRAEREAA